LTGWISRKVITIIEKAAVKIPKYIGFIELCIVYPILLIHKYANPELVLPASAAATPQ
jgi:hypothetical protein